MLTEEGKPGERLRRYVYVSRLDRSLMPTLADFIGRGLKQGDLCIAILSPRHKRSVNKMLAEQGIDIKTAARNGQYLTLNAKNILSVIDFGGQFDEATYKQAIENASTLVADGQPVRVFGEIVGLRWPGLISSRSLAS